MIANKSGQYQNVSHLKINVPHNHMITMKKGEVRKFLIPMGKLTSMTKRT